MSKSYDEWAVYHADHPELWQAMIAVCQEERIDSEREWHRIAAVFERLRERGVKLSNDWKPFYARALNRHFGTGAKFIVHRLQAEIMEAGND